jgi:hypothetical protein
MRCGSSLFVYLLIFSVYICGCVTTLLEIFLAVKALAVKISGCSTSLRDLRMHLWAGFCSRLQCTPASAAAASCAQLHQIMFQLVPNYVSIRGCLMTPICVRGNTAIVQLGLAGHWTICRCCLRMHLASAAVDMPAAI